MRYYLQIFTVCSVYTHTHTHTHIYIYIYIMDIKKGAYCIE